ncbi:hypothetical protein ACFXHD_34575 [Streptomyces hydrogenans]|uniref:hypothetical protein n=1 Tax=Streptomyces hydrogenans TaxID=1873719 RepID=UPI0036BD3279
MNVSTHTGSARNALLYRRNAHNWAFCNTLGADSGLADFLHTYNHHRCHTALGVHLPISGSAGNPRRPDIGWDVANPE